MVKHLHTKIFRRTTNNTQWGKKKKTSNKINDILAYLIFLKQAIHARIHMSFFLILKPFVPGISLQDSPVVRTDKHFRTDNSFVVIYKHSTSDNTQHNNKTASEILFHTIFIESYCKCQNTTVDESR